MTRLLVFVALCVSARSALAQSAKDVAALLDSIVPAALRAEHLPGAVVSVVSGGRVIHSRGYGVADVESGRPMTDSTIVRIGSISKVMTALAVAQLADRGRIRLDADVREYVKSVELPRWRTPITPWHLLTHTAALDEIRPGTQADARDKVLPLGEFLRGKLVRYAPPGVATAYSTYGITLAGVLVEDVSGQSFEEYLTTQIWRPLGMRHTSIDVSESQRALVAVPYDIENDTPVRAPWEWYHTTPASSVNSTARDMAAFMLAQLAGRSAVLSERMTREMQREQITMHPELPGFGLGWQQLRRANGDRGVQHGGDVAGFSSLVTLLPARNFGVFVASHGEGSNLRHVVTRGVLDRFFPARSAAAAPLSMHARDVASRQVAKYAGHYRAMIACHSCANPRPVTEVDVIANGDGTLSAFGGRFVEVSRGFFRSVDGERRFGFREDSLGRVTHLTVGSWQVLERVPMVGSSFDTAAIRVTALDYIDGWYTGNAERMERALHPDLAKRIWRPDPERHRSRLENQTAMTLVLNTRRGGGRDTPHERQLRDIEILDIYGNTASVRARMSDWIDLMHLARIDGQWRIVNVLWEFSTPEAGEAPIRQPRPSVASAKTQNPDLWREIQAVNDSMAAAFNRGDLLAVARFYTDDAIVDGPRGERVEGRAALDKYWLDIRNPKSWKLEVLGVGGPPDFPYQLGRSTLVTSSPTGDQTSVVEFLALWRREADGRLRLAVDYYRF